MSLNLKVASINVLIQRGFTLIELLIVLVLIGITATFAVLAVGDFGQSRKLETAAEQLSIVIPLAEQQAILEPAIYGLTFTNQGYMFNQFIIDKDHPKGHWQTLQKDHVLGFRAWPKNLIYDLKIAKQIPIPIKSKSTLSPQIVISSNGDITPFVLQLGFQGEAYKYKISGEFNGDVEMTEIE